MNATKRNPGGILTQVMHATRGRCGRSASRHRPTTSGQAADSPVGRGRGRPTAGPGALRAAAKRPVLRSKAGRQPVLGSGGRVNYLRLGGSGVVECSGEAPRVPPVHPALAAPPRPRLHGCPKPLGRDDLGLLAADRALERISVRTAAHRARLVRRHGNGERVRVRHGRHAGCRGRRGASGPPGHGWHRRARGRVPVRAHECALQASRRQSCRAERGVDTTQHDHAGGHVDNGPDAVEATQDLTWMRSATSSWCAAELGACVRRHPVWCVADPRDAWPRACGHT